MPIVEPPGGHAIYIDAARLLPHIPPHQFPGQALAVELYRQAGIRAVEIGSRDVRPPIRTGQEPPPMELVRLAIPRRVYTQSHIDYVVEAILEIWKNRERIQGLRLSHEAPYLRHFTTRGRAGGRARPLVQHAVLQ